jgi:GNAT superfamily N-acetyltransferase
MEISIRPAAAADARTVSDLAWRAKSSWGYPAEWLEMWRPALTITSEYLLAHDSHVAVLEHEIVGVCVLESHGETFSIEHLWIAPEQHRRGIGRALLERALTHAARAGAARVRVESDPFAETFYARMGGRRLGEIPAPMPGAPGRTLPLLEFVPAT